MPVIKEKTTTLRLYGMSSSAQLSTESKSRINFLQILHRSDPQYFINADSADYIETIKPYLKITSTPELKLPSEFTLFTKYVVDIFLF